MDLRGVLVGLGNPGPKYAGTRHNTGFLLVDRLLELAHREGEVEELRGKSFECELWRVRRRALDGLWLVARPQTFMNLSGQCVQPLLAWHRLPPSMLVVAHDELDLPPGALRFKLGGGDAGHNGLKSITQRLGTGEYHRLRLGIGRPLQREDVTGWVLGRMPREQAELWEDAMDAGLLVLSDFAKKGLEAAAGRATRESRRLALRAEES